MTNSTFPFAFDPEKMKDMFKMPEFDKMFETAKMPGMDMQAMIDAHQKNVAALVEANKIVMAGYQELYKRQVALVEESLAKAKDQMMDMQAQPMSTEHTQKQMDSMKEALERIANDIRELADMAQKANVDAFNIIKARFDEAMSEFKAKADQTLAG
ncbi:MAG: phasin family protein [Pikeienuella sp.]